MGNPMKNVSLVFLIAMLTAYSVNASPNEDNCVLAVNSILPSGTVAQRVTAKPVTVDVAAQRMNTINNSLTSGWVQVDMTMTVGDRRIQKTYFCAEHRDGHRIVRPTDNTGPQPFNTWIVR